MADRVISMLEKLVALATSQRFVTTVIGVVVIVALLQGAFAEVLGFEPWAAPDEAALEARIVAIVGNVAALVTALIAVLKLFAGLQESIAVDPPKLTRDWDIRYSQGTVAGYETEDPAKS